MENRKIMDDDEVEIDLLRLAQALFKKAWAIILACVLFGGAALAYTVLFVTPLYKAEVLLYVNSSDISVGGAKLSISQGEINAAQSLIKTYAVILKTRTTLNEVIAQSGVDYTYEQLAEMIEASSVNNTEVFSVQVISASPEEAENIANTIAVVLPNKISAIVEGTSARIVDMAVVPQKKTSPSISKNTLIGMMMGFLLSCGVIVVQELMDDKIHDSDYLLRTFEIPVLAEIPDLMAGDSDKGYYRSTTQQSRKER